jgi:hypothetical protein
MEGISSHAPVIGYLAPLVPDGRFTLVDIGCSGGIDPIWRSFGARLQAVAIDGNVSEIERLRRAESDPAVTYVAALATLPEDHPFARLKKGQPHWTRNPWDRLSVARSIAQMRQDRSRSMEDKMAVNDWPELQQAEQRIVIPRYLDEQGITSVDFIKLDVDGPDFEILHSFDGALDRLGVLGVGIEVNYFGSDSETEHTFHNVDRFMKGRGFELFGLTVRRYSMADLPGRYVWTHPTATRIGRPFQGDAIYIRDLADPGYHSMAAALPVNRLVNLLCLYAAFGLPDCAANVAVQFRDRLGEVCDVDRVLDILAAQAQWPANNPLSYREYMRRFELHDRQLFFTDPAPPVSPQAEQGAAAASDVEALRQQLADATNRIRTMESSRFWQLRRRWLHLKRLAGLAGAE